MSSDQFSLPPIYSTLSSDPDLAELVDQFVTVLPRRIEALQEAFDSGDYHQIETLAHQLKGTLGSYGFDELTSHALMLEDSVRDFRNDDVVEDALLSFVSNCGRIRMGIQGED